MRRKIRIFVYSAKRMAREQKRYEMALVVVGDNTNNGGITKSRTTHSSDPKRKERI
jgi:hypothetical protein